MYFLFAPTRVKYAENQFSFSGMNLTETARPIKPPAGQANPVACPAGRLIAQIYSESVNTRPR